MTTPVPVALDCPHCGRPVKLTYVPDGSSIAKRHVWICPYADCRQMEVITLCGQTPTVATDVFRRD